MQCQSFLDRELLLTMQLLNQGFLLAKLMSSLRQFYGHHYDLVNHYGIYVSQMTTGMFHFLFLFSFMAYHRVCNRSNTTGATSGAGTAHPSGAAKFNPGFERGSCCSISYFLCSVLQIVVCTFSFGHCVVCPSIYDF